jgi:two-component system, cell cycle response regulator DivK
MARRDAGDPAAEDVPVDAAKNQRSPALRTILVVEDDDLDMKLFHDLLSENGYRILQTRDGRQALELARRHRPDVILMDIQLPEVSGLEVASLIKQDDALKAIPIIAVTAYLSDWSDWSEGAMEDAGYAACIAKPISITGFLDTIDRVLG